MAEYSITEPGIYDLPADAYHADPVPGMSLSSTGARAILNTCPAKFFYDLTADRDTKKKHFSIGEAAHVIVLEPGLFAEKIVVVDADNWRTNAAQSAREAATRAGKTAILKGQLSELKEMRAVIWGDAAIRPAFEGAIYEKSLFWRDPETGIMCRCRPDILPLNKPFLVDYKTAADASPAKFERAIYDHGYHQQAAWYLEGYEVLYGKKLDNFWFIAQEKTAPYLTGVYRVSAAGLEIGRMLNRRAKMIFAHCFKTQHWPGYIPDFTGKKIYFTAEPPPWVEKQHEYRMEDGFYENIPGITEGTANDGE